MKKVSILLLFLLITTLGIGKSVSFEKAKMVANIYFSKYAGKSSHTVAESFSKSYNGIITYYVFNYTGGGFVVVSADDAVTPILAQSNESFIEYDITNPTLKFWFDNYNKEIAHIVASQNDIKAASPEWDAILLKQTNSTEQVVGPLLLETRWDQGVRYNYYCPTDTKGPGSKAWAGCVATAMGQIMKYYHFPQKGVGSYSYVHPKYGTLSADFAATNYNFTMMEAEATSVSYREIAMLLYHAGVSVNMNYAADGSGAYSEEVPWALGRYFNYNLASMKYESKANYTNDAWIELLKNEINAGRPLYYSGSSSSGGHAWVCDGYRSSDNKFHMNWGWSGSSDGWFAIASSITPTGSNYTFNTGFNVITGIKPGNPNLIVQFNNLKKDNTVQYKSIFNINCSVVTGNPSSVKLYIDNKAVFQTTQSTFTFPWNTASTSLGTHTVRVEAIAGTDTVRQEVNIGLSEWVAQKSGISTFLRGIRDIHVVDSLTVWAITSDYTSGSSLAVNEFTRTTDGGATWTPGSVLGGTDYGLGNICGLNADIAYVSVYHRSSQDKVCGVYKTKDGGKTWLQLPGALQGAASFADNVWFWNENTGFCHGDVKDGYFEIYTTTDGGATWNRVPKEKIGNGENPADGEGGYTSVIQAVGDNTVIFGTNKGSIYISHDRGNNWTISKADIAANDGGVGDISFKDKLNGLVAKFGNSLVLKETHDGGVTWKAINPVGPIKKSDLAFVPGTSATYITTGSSGASYSYDGGYTWEQFKGTESNYFLAANFLNNRCGWTGSFADNKGQNGMYKFTGLLDPNAVLNPAANLLCQTLDKSVQLTWEKPANTPASYNVYRNDTLIINVSSLQYSDPKVAVGQQNYCVTAVYSGGESPKICATTWITLNLKPTDEAAYKVYPNPATSYFNIISPVKFSEIKLLNNAGKTVYQSSSYGTNLKIQTDDLSNGLYFLQIVTAKQIVTKKIMISR